MGGGRRGDEGGGDEGSGRGMSGRGDEGKGRSYVSTSELNITAWGGV